MIAAAIVTAVLTLVLCPVVIGGLRRGGVLDHPNDRSCHAVAVPRGGGLAPGVGAVVGLTLISGLALHNRLALVGYIVGFGGLGLAEDLFGIPARRRLALQFVIAGGLLTILLVGLRGAMPWKIVFALGVAIWLVAFVNAFNFMDGINGISSAQAVLAAAAWTFIGAVRHVPALEAGSLVVGAAALAFLPFNFPTARVFLGDVGSYAIGAGLATLVVIGLRAGVPPEAMLAPLGLYLVDTSVTIIRRTRRGDVWCEAHREHAYQHLVAGGWGHSQTTAYVAMVIGCSSAVGLASLHMTPGGRAVCDLSLVALLAGYVATPTLIRHHVLAT